jgi:hypothetical protein
MLDDDDQWSDNHVETVVGTFIKWFEAAFVVTLSQYGEDPNSCMPYEITPSTSEPVYNNYIPTRCTCVRSSTSHNLHLLSDDTLSLWEEIEESAIAAHAADGSDKGSIMPADAQLLDRVGAKVRNGKYKSICCPVKTVAKLSDANMGNIPTPGLSIHGEDEAPAEEEVEPAAAEEEAPAEAEEPAAAEEEEEPAAAEEDEPDNAE